MVLLLRFFKIYIVKPRLSKLNECIRSTQKSSKFLILFERTKFNLYNKFENLTNYHNGLIDFKDLKCSTKIVDELVIEYALERMMSFSEKILQIIPKTKKSKKSHRKERLLKNKEKMSLISDCESPSTVCCTDVQVVRNSTNIFTSTLSSENTSTMVLSYRDVLTNSSTPILNAEENNNLKEVFKNIRYDVYTPYGKWIKYDERAMQGTSIKVLSYNILSQGLLEMFPYLYVKHDKKFLSWEYRSKALIQEFIEFDADILCLQEVEISKLEFFNNVLAQMGYKGEFKKRTGGHEDGCAIYYRENKFSMKELVSVEYYQPNFSLLNRDNIGLIMRLTPKDNLDKDVVVGTTHLLFNPRRHDVKVAQMQIMLAEMERVAFKNVYNGFTHYHPIILTGDFNMTPFTYVYNLLMNGWMDPQELRLMSPHLGITNYCQHHELTLNRRPPRTETSDIRYVKLHNTEYKNSQQQRYPKQELNWRRRDYYNQREERPNYLYHRLNLNSVYPHLYPDGGYRYASTFQDAWCTVDYIFYGPTRMLKGQKVDGDLKLISYLKLPYHYEADTLKTIPNEVCASDHLPLLATFHLATSV